MKLFFLMMVVYITQMMQEQRYQVGILATMLVNFILLRCTLMLVANM